ncbi:sulfatase-like hydrolase/transferase [Puniceicoccales bacterium CK1056]|uniref:Sulfatase-like hydrolase/transferase n=1 Tax=Oceanipulchritudo coccoides TaxID=2706888 RepID=A0A6B2M527_9BACT|nr:sulfatase-like hydrolase/transferase [Oceanipulchritudo coccoides]NDV63207.1 sulfatase-like hydrolase/transferase [Oceanipulchritudo coccoides]
MQLKLVPISLLTLCSLTNAHLAAEDQPNVLFIAIDDLVTTIGPYDDPHAITPAMDSLASQGTTFRNHHCQWPVCGPSRAALTTGLLPEETGVMGFRPIRAILPDVITLPQHFRNNGYETAATGKFHDPRTVGNIVDPNSQTTDGRNIDDPASWSIPYVRADAGYSPSGKPAVDDSLADETQHGDYKILDEGKALLDILEGGTKPFFLAVGFKKPHLPFIAPAADWALYDRNQFSPAPLQDLPFNSSSYVDATLGDNDELLGYEPYDVTGLPTDEQQKELIHGYYACVSFIDSLVGNLLAHLATKSDPLDPAKNMSETTIIVLWGDHGFHLGDHGKWAKHTVMERATAAPLIIYDPRNPAGGVMNFHPANSIDIYPTLVELANLPIPEQPLNDTITTGRPLRGSSLASMLHDSDAAVNSGAITYISRNGGYGYSYRSDRYRYIEWVDSSNVVQARELYDYKMDPFETRNVIDDPANAAIAYQLSRSMRAETSSRGADRMQGSAPIPASGAEITLGNGYLPGVKIEASSASGSPMVTLDWPGATGVSYDIMSSTTLAPSSWSASPDGISGDQIVVPLNGTRRFFQIAIGSNTPPLFNRNAITADDAEVDASYSFELSAFVEDPDVGDSLTFSKVSGPIWLTVAPSGTISGNPLTGDLGVHYAKVEVADASGAIDLAEVCLSVVPAGPATQTDTFYATDDTFAKLSNTTLIPGGQAVLEVRQDGASIFTRITYLKFSVSGIGTVQEVRLYLHSNTETDPVNVHLVTDTSWSEGSLNWDNRPPYSTLVGSGIPTAGAWLSIDITPAISSDGTYSFALDEQGNSLGKFDSSEAGFTPYIEIVSIP